MGEIGDEYRDIKEFQKEKRWSNYESSKQMLIDSGVEYQEFANGHFRVGAYDFWATTGLIIHRITKKRGRGIESLLSKILPKAPNPTE